MISPPLPPELEAFRVIDERTVAPILGVSLSTLRNWRVTGCGPEYFKVNGRAVRYSLASTLAWRDQQTVRPRR